MIKLKNLNFTQKAMRNHKNLGQLLSFSKWMGKLETLIKTAWDSSRVAGSRGSKWKLQSLIPYSLQNQLHQFI